VLVDGKADRDLFGRVLALARRFGRDDDVRVLNFMVASGLNDSHSFNAFATGNADAIRELLASQLGERQQTDPNGVLRERAVALIGTIAPVLVWLPRPQGNLAEYRLGCPFPQASRPARFSRRRDGRWRRGRSYRRRRPSSGRKRGS